MELYVDAVNGCDYNSGAHPTDSTGHGPVRTIGRAVTKIETLRQTGADEPVTVWLMPGIYALTAPMRIPAGCSGVTFRAMYGGVTITGARRLEHLRADALYGVRCLSAEVPAGAIPTDLFTDSGWADVTRWPESGTLAPLETGSRTGALFDGTDWFVADRDLSGWDGLPDATLVFRHFWIEERAKIASFDPETRKAVLDRRTTFSAYTAGPVPGGGDGGINGETDPSESDANSRMDYWIEGLPQMLRKPNQWVYLPRTNRIYYIPADFDAENALYVPMTTRLFDVYADGVSFEGLTFRHTSSRFEPDTLRTFNKNGDGADKRAANDVQALYSADAVVNFYGAADGRVDRCDFLDYGLYGVGIDASCSDIAVTHCRFERAGGGGVKVSHNGCPSADVPGAHHIEISDCRILHIGRVRPSACGVLITLGHHCRVTHNEIAFTGYSGISVGWEWGYKEGKSHHNRIEKNHIHHISMGQLSDLGGVYLLGRQEGTVVTGNRIHDVVHKTYGGSGIYADEGSSGILFENNVCTGVSYAGFQIHFGTHNVIRNNILESGSLGAFWNWKNDLAPAAELKHNILIAKNADFIFGGQTVDVLSANIDRDWNLYFDRTKPEPVMYRYFAARKNFAALQTEQGTDRNSVTADPRFADEVHGNFALAADSPAHQIGFLDIDLHDAGPRD